MIRFYAPDILATGTLPESDSAHCSRVLRLSEGDHIQVTDGKGGLYDCIITESHPKHTQVEIAAVLDTNGTRRFRVTLAVAPTKHTDRMEWLLEKAVEIGVDRIILLRCQRSERKSLKPDRLLKVMVAAMKQSLKTVLPELTVMETFREFMEKKPEGQKFMGYCDSSFERLDFSKAVTPEGDITILIGPEGDFSPAEVDMAVNNGFKPVTFGNTRLRTETAALYGLTAVHVLAQLNDTTEN